MQDRSARCSSAAFGCNLAWGLVDAVMYLVRTVTERGTLAHARPLRALRPATPETGRRFIERSLSRVAAGLVVGRRKSRRFAGASSR